MFGVGNGYLFVWVIGLNFVGCLFVWMFGKFAVNCLFGIIGGFFLYV